METASMTDVKAENSAQGDEQQPGLDPVDEQLIGRLASRARAGGLQLAGEGGLLQQLTKRLLESALEGSSPTTSATTVTTRPGATAATLATGTGRRPC
jgi:hypothetical protein